MQETELKGIGCGGVEIRSGTGEINEYKYWRVFSTYFVITRKSAVGVG
jgi:hypothetical protein